MRVTILEMTLLVSTEAFSYNHLARLKTLFVFICNNQFHFTTVLHLPYYLWLEW